MITLARRAGRNFKAAANATAGTFTVGLLRGLRATDRKRMSDFAAACMRTLGPRLKEHRIGRENLTAAFPEKTREEIERILSGVWSNLGRVAAEFVHIDGLRILAPPRHETGDIVYTLETAEGFERLRGKPALVFAAHLANWELPALIANTFGLDATVLYRRPNISAFGDAVIQIRRGSMGTLVPTTIDAPFKLVRVLEGGGRVAMLVDQHYVNGVDVTFFGRMCKANPFIARLARHINCPIYGTRVVRLCDPHRFRAEISEPIHAPRDREGKIDVQGTMQAITSVIEGWVREQPDQWLWVHRRWR
jgi:KDO2-lipid IV(A) lauroyltransferase